MPEFSQRVSWGVLLSLMLFTTALQAQETPPYTLVSNRSMDDELQLVVGYHGPIRQGFVLGIAHGQIGADGHHPFARVFSVYNELIVGNQLIWAPSAGAWIGGGAAGMALGINGAYYTNGTAGSFRLRPEIGLGPGRLKITYGYNFALTNSDFEGINQHQLSLVLYPRLIKLRTIKS